MIVDNTIADIITTIQKEVKQKFDIDLDFEQVLEVINIQMTATAFGFARNIPIYWRGFLKFIWTNRRQRNKDKKELFSKVSDPNNNLTTEERAYYNYLAKIVAHSSYKELEALNIRAKGLSAKEVNNIPSNSNKFKVFKSLLIKRTK